MGCGIFSSLLLILVGIWIWASNYGIRVFSFYRDWPLLFVVLGLWILLKINRRRKRIRKD
jgi:hypothetical protein